MEILAKIHDSANERKACLKKILTLGQQLPISSPCQIVFTKGVFDILHKGHLHLIAFCSELKSKHPNGVFVVGIPTDAAVKERKGPLRPLNKFADRAEQIAALGSVDFVAPFDEGYPIGLIKLLKPRFYVKGQDTAGINPTNGINSILLEDSNSNPELDALIACGTEVIIYCDDGSSSTSALVRQILRVHGS
jgi:cytidyltransferase-like protein